MSGLEDLILEHYEEPFRPRCIARPTKTVSVENKSCGDSVEFQLFVSDERVFVVGLETSGCVLSSASASMLAEAIDGKLISELPSETEWMSRFKEIVTPKKRQCALLPWQVLQQI